MWNYTDLRNTIFKGTIPPPITSSNNPSSSSTVTTPTTDTDTDQTSTSTESDSNYMKDEATDLINNTNILLYNGNTIEKVLCEHICHVISEDILLDMYKTSDYQSNLALQKVKEMAKHHLYNVQWSYSDMCNYLLASNYHYNVMFCLKNKVYFNVIQCNYMDDTYTMLDMLDVMRMLNPKITRYNQLRKEVDYVINPASQINGIEKNMSDLLSFHYGIILPFTHSTMKDDAAIDHVQAEHTFTLLRLFYYAGTVKHIEG